jgi:hypothetical protein
VKTKQSRSATIGTRGNKCLSQEFRPVLVLSMGAVTLGSALAAHSVLHTPVPVPVLVVLTVLSIVVSRCRAVVIALLGMLYGLTVLGLGVVHVVCTGKDPGPYLAANLEKIVMAVRYKPRSPAQSATAMNDHQTRSLQPDGQPGHLSNGLCQEAA